jgi:hypothetical protein
MPDTHYVVTCTSRSRATRHCDGHIVSVGTVLAGPGSTNHFTVQQVYTLMAAGAIFVTVGRMSKKFAVVHRFRCACGVQTLRTGPDAVSDNNLDALPRC